MVVIIIAALWLTLTATNALPSEDSVTLSDEVLLRIGDSFAEEGEYYRAITEYKKILILFPRSEYADKALYNIGISYFRGEEYESAAAAFYNLRQRFQESRYKLPSHLYEGLIYRKLKKYEDAKVKFDTVIDFYPGSQLAPVAIISKALVALDEKNAEQGKRELWRLIQEYPESPAAEKAHDALRLLNKYDELPRKSRFAAGAMSAILPGSGYVYAERSGDGITAFIINALFISGTITAINQRNYSTAYIVAGFGLPFYIGNIYGSANAAKKWNLNMRSEVENEVYGILNVKF